jgi:hypothetical protein
VAFDDEDEYEEKDDDS